jgi:acid phosphatase type 7
MTAKNRIAFTLHVLVPALLLAAMLTQFTFAASTAPRHVRLSWISDPATEATISWTTDGAGAAHRVRFRADNGEEWTSVECQRSEQFNGRLDDHAAPYAHHARLTDLEPATKYHVVCQSDGDSSREVNFVTAPNDDRPIALLFGGDSRSGLDERKRMNRMMARMVAEQTAADRPEIVALAHGGDYVGNGTNLEQWLVWLEDHQLTTGPNGQLLPIIPARGNHDMGPIFNQVFGYPTDDENYYAINLGSEVRLATLNTETSTAGEQRQWLASELASNRWDSRWYLCQYHKPAFPAVKVPSGALTNWVPLFEQYQVDLVCEADGHVIKRTVPIKNMKADPTGVVYIGEGGLGVGQRTPKTHRWFLQETAEACGSGHHVHLFTFSDRQLDCRVIQQDGKVFDEFTLEARRAPQTTAAVR